MLSYELWCLFQVSSEFQAYKHMKILAPGELARAAEALEATVALRPTLILTNALPYHLDVTVWQARQATADS